jgi:hypothetical protein
VLDCGAFAGTWSRRYSDRPWQVDRLSRATDSGRCLIYGEPARYPDLIRRTKLATERRRHEVPRSCVEVLLLEVVQVRGR